MPVAIAIERAPATEVLERSASACLRQQTRAAHERAEAVVLRNLNRSSRASYVRYLERAFGLYSSLEATLLTTPDYTERVTDFAARRKVPWLLEDLRYFGRDESELPWCSTLPRVKSAHGMLGMAYVFEGAALGGPVLLGSLGFEPRPSPARGARFLSGYGAETSQRWRTFKRVLDEAANDKSELAQMVQGARQAFAAFEAWVAAS